MQEKLTWRREKNDDGMAANVDYEGAGFALSRLLKSIWGKFQGFVVRVCPLSRGPLPNPWLFNQDYEFTLFQIRGCFYCLVFSDFGFRPLFLLFGYVITTVCAFLPLQDSSKSFLLRLQYFVTPQNCVSYACHMRFFILHAHWKRWIIFCIAQFCQLFNFLISLVHPNLTSIL